VENNLGGITIPGLLIQPLVENSVKHGIAPLPNGGKITVKCWIQDDHINIVVHDTGAGFNNSHNYNGASHGIYNVRERLKLTYNSLASLTCKNENGALVELVIPRRTVKWTIE
jgi:sensor histidine kinase YesM